MGDQPSVTMRGTYICVVLAFVAVSVNSSSLAEDAVMPEQELTSFYDDERPISALLQESLDLASRDPDTAFTALADMVQATPTRDLSKLKAAIQKLIDDVKSEHA